ncbi:MAG: MarR family transcriptional regulator [Armatimonadetes bacterium]|nr:MarR family transcriptional regulator [Armatimonadota bacterium]MBS1727443.1 MarR family transcriptional regulator [Armatimonadota bacterium]
MQLYPEIDPIREASRQMVRGLGLLELSPMFGVPFNQRHALIEIERAGAITVNQLGEALLVDRSVASRIAAALERQGLVATSSDPVDARKKLLSLTPKGIECTLGIHDACNEPVASALKLLSPEDRQRVVEGLEIYGRALLKAARTKDLVIRKIEPTDDAQVAQLIRAVMTEGGLVGPGYSINDPEVLSMSENYPAPRAAFYVVVRQKQVLGCGGFAPLTGGSDDVCELRKMYFSPEIRGIGMAQNLISVILADAKTAGYRRMYLETTQKQDKARALYARNGFTPIDGPLGSTGHCACDTFCIREV